MYGHTALAVCLVGAARRPAPPGRAESRDDSPLLIDVQDVPHRSLQTQISCLHERRATSFSWEGVLLLRYYVLSKHPSTDQKSPRAQESRDFSLCLETRPPMNLPEGGLGVGTKKEAPPPSLFFLKNAQHSTLSTARFHSNILPSQRPRSSSA